jgi:hypothetical protein
MQMKTRKEKRFDEVEAGLPKLTPNIAFRNLGSFVSRFTKMSELLSYLGPYNPKPAAITAKDAVWLFDNIAFKNPRGNWEAEFVSAVLTQHTTCVVAEAVAQVAERIGLSKDDAETERIEQRLMPFLMDIQPGRLVNATFGSDTALKLGPGGRNGISSDIRAIPAGKSGEIVSTFAKVPVGTSGLLEMKTEYTEPEGWAVVSGWFPCLRATQMTARNRLTMRFSQMSMTPSRLP